MVQAKNVVFMRSIKPAVSVGQLELVGSRDSGDRASAGCLYAKFERDEEETKAFSLRLLVAKERVTPFSAVEGRLRRSIPRT